MAGSEALYRSVIEQMNDLFYRTDSEGIVVLASPSALKLTGAVRMDEIIGQPIVNFWKYPEKRTEMIHLIHQNGHVADYRLEMIRLDGTEATVSVSSHFLYDEDGLFSGIEGIIRDVTERIHHEKALRESEEKFRLIAENTSDGILILNSAGSIEYVSPAFENQSGYSAAEKMGLTADQIFQQLHPDDREAVFSRIYQAIDAKESDLIYNFRTLRKNGEYYYREDHAHFQYDKAGNHVKTYVTCRDITERHLAHLELVKAKEKAVESDNLKSSFLANISHEIRTPLNGILGFAEVLKTPGLGNHETTECIDIINASSRQLLGIINDIVEISKIETRQAKISVTTFPVVDVLRNVFHNFKPDLSDKNLVFKIHTDNINPRLSVTTDQTKLQQIVANFADNALKFTERGLVELGANYSEDDGFVRFYVRDTGPGIRKSDQQIIFERFRQLDQSLSRVKGGTGLGLTICKAFAELLGSSVDVQSEPGKGSVFSVRLPVTLTDCAAESAESGEESAISRYPDLQGRKVLVVDDEDINMRYLSVLLRRSNATIVKAVNGLQALELFDLHRDLLLVLLDIKMPGISGLEVAREIRKTNRSIPVVAQTACALSEEKKAASEAGCTDYITKPISESIFVSMLRKYAR